MGTVVRPAVTPGSCGLIDHVNEITVSAVAVDIGWFDAGMPTGSIAAITRADPESAVPIAGLSGATGISTCLALRRAFDHHQGIGSPVGNVTNLGSRVGPENPVTVAGSCISAIPHVVGLSEVPSLRIDSVHRVGRAIVSFNRLA